MGKLIKPKSLLKCCKKQKETANLAWFAYVAITNFNDKIMLKVHIDYEANKNDASMIELSNSFANSMCNFQTFVAQEFAIQEMFGT